MLGAGALGTVHVPRNAGPVYRLPSTTSIVMFRVPANAGLNVTARLTVR